MHSFRRPAIVAACALFAGCSAPDHRPNPAVASQTEVDFDASRSEGATRSDAATSDDAATGTGMATNGDAGPSDDAMASDDAATPGSDDAPTTVVPTWSGDGAAGDDAEAGDHTAMSVDAASDDAPASPDAGAHDDGVAGPDGDAVDGDASADASASDDATAVVGTGTADGAVAIDAEAGIVGVAIDAAPPVPYVPATGGYSVQCPWLVDTSSMVSHLLRSADFYVNVADPLYGGFFTYLDQKGSPKSTNKSFHVQSRDAYAFAHAFMVSGNESYLLAARQALDFLYAHAWDPKSGGFVFLGDRQGNWLPAPPGVPSDKWSFTQHYALAGPTAMCEASPNATDCASMNSGMQLLEKHYWDPTNGGYFNNADLNYTTAWEKGFTPTIDGLTPHILVTYLVTQDPGYRARLVSLADDAAVHLVGSSSAPGVSFGFPEFFDSAWAIDTGNTYGFVGHLYKTAWALARAYLITGDPKYRSASRSLLLQLWNGGGFDHTNGAPNFDYRFDGGVGSTNKEYWQLEQGFTSGITNWYVATSDADRAIYAEQADRSLCFFMRHMPDTQYGGIFFETNADGSSLVSDGSDAATDKGDQWEGAYHNVELSYYAYVYGNLLLWHKPITLYYRLAAGPAEQTFTLNPLEIESGGLVIAGVRLAGQPYGDFDGAARTVHLAPGAGGVFAVTYAHAP